MSKLEFMLGDKVSFDKVVNKRLKFKANGDSEIVHAESDIEPKIGIINGYRSLPYGTVSDDEYRNFTVKGRIGVYLVTTNLHLKPHRVPVSNITLIERLDKTAVLKGKHNITSHHTKIV